MENENGFYFSEYMRNRQTVIFRFSGFKPPVNNWENGSEPGQIFVHETMDFKIPVKYNAIGLRGNLPDLIKDSSEKRIVVLGDSFAEGFGADKDSTFPALLQHKLNSIQGNTTVINGGKCGSNPYFETRLYKNVLEKWNPDLVIMEVNVCDIAEFEIATNQDVMPLKEYFLAISHIYRILDNGLFIRNMILKDAPEKIAQKRSAEIIKMIKFLKDFELSLAEKNTKFLVVYLPLLPEMNTTRFRLAISHELKDSLQNSQLSFLDLTPKYKNVIKDSSDVIYKYYYYNDHHHTPSGYNLMAVSVADFILSDTMN